MPLRTPTPVYPRWRGELPNHGNIYRVDLGLSPLARGTQIGMAAVVAFFRFIPAGAGNSVNPITKNMKPSVYPRWRGELSKSIHLFLKHFFP